ncbi:MAG TPA: hypothetical protein VEC60_01905 [Reyranella sp.]|nr:hypothetical protein [Reyranella sp.]
MKRMKRAGLRAIAAAVLALTATLFAAATPSEAASVTLNFDGTVTSTNGLFTVLGVTAGDAVSGSITVDPADGIVKPVFGGTLFDLSTLSFTFHVEHPGVVDFTRTDSGASMIQDMALPGGPTYLTVTAGGAISTLLLDFETDGTGHTPLTSLAGLPTTADGIIAMLTGATLTAAGSYDIAGYGSVGFDLNLTPVTTTPIPAALPLFGAGLAVLGFVARKQRKAARAT